MGNERECEIEVITNVRMITQNKVTGVTYDISNSVKSIQYDTSITDTQAGTLKFTLVKQDAWKPKEGDIVRFSYNSQNVFYGKVFKANVKAKDGWQVTCYDLLRYLKNEDTLVLPSMTSGQVVRKVCEVNNLPCRIVDDSPYYAPEIIHDKKSYFSMIDDAIGKAIINTGNWYCIRDSFGVIEHRSLLSMRTNLLLGDKSLVGDFDYEFSIDDSYNVVKLTKDNKETNKREVYEVYDSYNVGVWGKLQYHESVDENMEYAKIVEMANNILKSKNVVQKTLKLNNVIGMAGLTAGVGIYVMLSDLSGYMPQRPIPVFITKCSHKWENFHSMDIEVKVV